jgi:hypothetical protein
MDVDPFGCPEPCLRFPCIGSGHVRGVRRGSVVNLASGVPSPPASTVPGGRGSRGGGGAVKTRSSRRRLQTVSGTSKQFSRGLQRRSCGQRPGDWALTKTDSWGGFCASGAGDTARARDPLAPCGAAGAGSWGSAVPFGRFFEPLGRPRPLLGACWSAIRVRRGSLDFLFSFSSRRASRRKRRQHDTSKRTCVIRYWRAFSAYRGLRVLDGVRGAGAGLGGRFARIRGLRRRVLRGDQGFRKVIFLRERCSRA